MRVFSSLTWLVIGLASLLQAASAQVDPDDPDHGVRWVYPPRKEKFTFHYMDTIKVEWTSFFNAPLLYTFCTNDNGDIMERKMGSVQPFNASEGILLDWADEGSPCWFNLRPNTSTGYGSNCDSWSYETTQRNQVTLGADISSTATATASASTSSATGSSASGITTTSSLPSLLPASANPASTDAASEQISSSKGGLSVGAQAGIGAAAGIVGLGFGALGAVLWMRRRKKQKMVGDSAYAGMPAEVYGGYDYKGPSPRSLPGSSNYSSPQYSGMEDTSSRPELDAREPPAELPATYYGR